ncbi:hypothetical protein pdam_00007628 [Pocillopora damicornis]|uniref:Uncharacterized protein n=1 Tax=Pocillopora damicornis TaxID=46731 RepID=A0A3M6TZQ2_POCDA|nr:hypothetical protein pdam_00007628 [Pocillopora damicornis]
MLHQHLRSMKSDTCTKKKTIATYSKNHPIQLPKKEHFLTPDTPEIDWLPSCKEMSLKEDMSKKDRRLLLRGFSAAKVSSMGNKDCKIYKAELEKPKDVKKTKKSKVLASTTTYSSRSMSCCTACGGLSCRSGHSVGAKQATLKSMTICHSLDDLDLSFAESEVLQPQNSTLREDALSLELKDIFPQDLSAILEEPVDNKEIESPKRAKTDKENCKQKNKQKTVNSELCTHEASDPNLTPQIGSKTVGI